VFEKWVSFVFEGSEAGPGGGSAAGQAAHTVMVISSPWVSVMMNRLRPLIFLPAS
jgi:hypothetical protein